MKFFYKWSRYPRSIEVPLRGTYGYIIGNNITYNVTWKLESVITLIIKHYVTCPATVTFIGFIMHEYFQTQTFP